MNFLSNLFGRLFGRKPEDQPQPQAPAPASTSAPLSVQSAPSQPQPQIIAPQAPTINPASLVKVQPSAPAQPAAPQAPVPPPNLLQKVEDYFNPSVGGLDENNAFYNTVDRLNGGNSVIGQNGYFNKQVIQPVEQGVSAVKNGTPLEKVMGALGTVRGAFNASPLGLAANSAISSTSGLLKAIRGQDVNPLQEINNNSQISEGLGVKNPLAAGAIDLGTNLLAINPEGVAGGVSNLGKLKNAENAADVAKTLFSSAKSVLGLSKANPEEVVPGVKSANPDRVNIPKVGEAIPDTISKDAGLAPGTYNAIPAEDPKLQIPTIVRNQEAALQANQLSKAQVAGPRSLTDVTGKALTPEEVQAMHLGVPEAPGTKIDVQPIGKDIKAPTLPDTQIRQIVADRGVIKDVKFTDKPLMEPGTNNPAPFATDPTSRTLYVNPQELQGDLSHLDSGGKIEYGKNGEKTFQKVAGETPTQTAQRYLQEAVLPYEESHIKNQTVEQAQRRATGESTPVAQELDNQASQQLNPQAEAPQPQPAPAAGPTPPQAEAAPRLRSAITSQMKDTVDISKTGPQRDVLVQKDLANQAQAHLSTLTDQQVTDMYLHNFSPEKDVQTPQEWALANAALHRLYDLAQTGNQEAVTAAENALSGMQVGTSGKGQYLSLTRQAYKDMPVVMKIDRGLTQLANKVKAIYGPDSKELSAFADPANQAAVKNQLGVFFSKDKAIGDQIAALEGNIESMKADPTKFTDAQIGDVKQQLSDLNTQKAANAEQVAQFIDQTAPAKGKLGDTIAEIPRLSMLSSLSGRLRHVVGTVFNTGDQMAASKLSGAIGGVLNKVGDTPGKFLDTGISAGDLVKAIPEGINKIGQTFKGNAKFSSLEELDNAMRSGDLTKPLSDTSKSGAARTVSGFVEAPSHLSEGVGQGNVRMLARQEGQQAGFEGAALDQYTKIASISPSEEILAKAKLANQTVNNLNKTPLGDALGGIQKGISQIPVVGKFMARLIEPFPTFTGADFWNAVTDRNVVGNAGKMVVNILKGGDPQETIDQFSKLVVHGTEAAAAGYALAASGVLTETDANGKSYDGLYLHVGDRYIPVHTFAALAPNIIQGYAAYKAFQEHKDGESIMKSMADQTGVLLKTFASSFGASDLTGSSNSIVSAVNDVGTDPAKAGADLISGVGGGLIPAAGGDINSVLNQTSLNPTHEAADTKVVNPNSPSGTATDPVASAVRQLENKIPFLSQTLPRQEGVASQDFVDRVTQGNRDTSTTIANRETAQVAVDQSKDFKARGIPDFNGKYKDGATFQSAVEAKVENGDYSSAIEGLQAKLTHDSQNPNIPKSALKTQQDEIKRLKVASDGKFDPSVIDLYKKTSLTEWRDMGDPTNDAYDPKKYQLLWEYDGALAKQDVSRNNTSADMGFYSPKKPAKTKGKGVPTNISSNTVGSPVDLGKVNLSKITAGQATNVPALPKVTALKSSDLAKRRKISVSAGVS